MRRGNIVWLTIWALVALLVGARFPANAVEASHSTLDFSGHSNLTVNLVDRLGAFSGTYQFQAQVDVLAVLSPGSGPSKLQVIVGPSEFFGIPGEFALITSPVREDDVEPSPYWQIDIEESAAQYAKFTGHLVNTLSAGGLEPNFITVPVETAPGEVRATMLSMARGAELAGVISRDGAALLIRGTTSDGLRPFEIEIVAGMHGPTEHDGAFAPTSEGVSGYVRVNNVSLLSEPSLTSSVLATLQSGTEVIITGPSRSTLLSTYLPITLSNGLSGWVLEALVERTGIPSQSANGMPAIIVANAGIRDAPHRYGLIITYVPAGTAVTITGEPIRDFTDHSSAVYVPVTLGDGTTGWVLQWLIEAK